MDETRRSCSRWLKRARPAEDLVAAEFPELAEIAGSSCQSQDGSKLAAHLGKLASLYREIINRLSFRPRNTRLCWQKWHCNFYASREIRASFCILRNSTASRKKLARTAKFRAIWLHTRWVVWVDGETVWRGFHATILFLEKSVEIGREIYVPSLRTRLRIHFFKKCTDFKKEKLLTWQLSDCGFCLYQLMTKSVVT